MTQKVVLQIPTAVASAIEEAACGSTISELVVELLEQIMNGNRPHLDSEVSADFRFYCERTGATPANALRVLLLTAEEVDARFWPGKGQPDFGEAEASSAGEQLAKE